MICLDVELFSNYHYDIIVSSYIKNRDVYLSHTPTQIFINSSLGLYKFPEFLSPESQKLIEKMKMTNLVNFNLSQSTIFQATEGPN